MSPEDNSVPILDIQNTSTRLGAALNVACNLKSLNPENDIFVAAPMSGWTIAELIFRNIGNAVEQFTDEAWEPSRDELIKERFIDAKTNKQIVRTDNRLKFSDKIIKKFKKAFSHIIIEDFDCIVVSDYNKGCIDWSVVNKLKGIGCSIFVDTKQQDLSTWKDLGNVIVKINWKEFEQAKHVEQIRDLVVTHGEKPVQLRKNNQLVKEFVVRPVENPDVCGAGDVFLSGLVVEYLKSQDLDKSIKFAICVAEKSIEKQGTCVVNEDEMK